MNNLEWKNNPRFTTGIWSYRGYALSRLKNECVKCNGKNNAKRLDVHHKNHDRNDNRLKNLEIICSICHRRNHVNFKKRFCLNCKSEIPVGSGRLRNKYCSTKCWYDNFRVKLNCKTCKKDFLIAKRYTKKRNRQFCSRDCWSKRNV